MISITLFMSFVGMSLAGDYMVTKDDWLKTCQIDDPNFEACSRESIQGLFKQLTTGIEGFTAIETIDPMKLNRIKIFQGEGPVSINSSLSKASVTGFAETQVIESKVNPIDYSWETHLFVPKIRIEGNYHMQGRILVIPLNGHGKCWFEPKNMDIIMKTKTHLYEKDGHVFYNITGTQVDYTLSGLKLRLDNLFDGVKVLEDSTNQYLNENWRPVSDALKPILAKTIEDILLVILNKVFHYIPADYMISDIPRPSQLYG
ncbi:protein takeout [Contarinia nasturtii]|uniref:protein takeout n=1 Tax=Contarinia nasturtii TaxID=265458 RepID=UPI0012D4AE3C|nr:protein takeout [Contarinia nasturtii]